MIRASRGFTLMELLATIAIAAVLSIMMVTFVGDYLQWTKKTANEYTLGILNGALTRFVSLGGIRSSHSLGGPNTDAKVSAVIGALRTGLTVGGARSPFISPNDSVVASQAYVTGTGKNFNFCGYGLTLSSESSKSVAGTYVPAVVASSNLSGLVVTGGSGALVTTPSFVPGTTSYMITTGYDEASVTVTPTAVSGDDAVITVAGETVISGGTSSAIPLTAGATTNIAVNVTGPGVATLPYTIGVTRPEDRAFLSSILMRRGIPSYAPAPPYTPATTAYNYNTLPGPAANYTMNAVAMYSGATLTMVMDGGAPQAMTSGANFTVSVLSVSGTHYLDITVTNASYPANNRTYHLTVVVP